MSMIKLFFRNRYTYTIRRRKTRPFCGPAGPDARAGFALGLESGLGSRPADKARQQRLARRRPGPLRQPSRRGAVPGPNPGRAAAGRPPDDRELVARLRSRRGWPESRGRLVLESKSDLRSRNLPSADRADAVLGALAGLQPTASKGWDAAAVKEAVSANQYPPPPLRRFVFTPRVWTPRRF